jgi:uncharacterized protein
VLNHLTGRPLDYGIKDYDLGYFDPSDLSYEAEDAVIRRVKTAFNEPLCSMIEVRNQARVHLRFPAKFGEAYGPLARTAEALECFASATFAVGVRLEPDDGLQIEAPFGLADLFALRLRPNPRRKTVGFARTSADVQRRWPEVVIDNGPPPRSSAGQFAKNPDTLDALDEKVIESHALLGWSDVDRISGREEGATE